MLIHSFIDNEFYLSSDKSFAKINAFTGEALHEVRSCDLMGLVLAIKAANAAFNQWKTSAYSERLDLVVNIQKILAAKKNEYAKLEALDQALPLHFVKASGLSAIENNIETLLKEVPSAQFSFSPVGVVALVASWNLSLRVILDRLIPALLAGNAVVVKVSSQSPISAHILAQILLEAQAPKGLVNIIVTDDRDVQKTLVSHPGVKAVSFTGSIEVGTEVLSALQKSSLQNFKKIQISAGSKNSAVALVEPTDVVFNQIMNSFMLGQGQLVWNSSRLFILEKQEAEWEERIRNYLSGIKPSESIEDDSAWTPCLKVSSFAKFDEIKRTATEDKAKLIEAEYALSDVQKQKYLTPIFTKDMSRCSTLQQDQIHSPFYILSTVKYPFDVAKYSNVSYFGFAAHLWGETEKLNKVAEALDVGLVSYNKFSAEVSGAFAGVKQSGFGLQDFQIFGAFYSNAKKLS